MERLDQKTILDIKKTLDEAKSPCPLFAYDFGETITATNGHWLMEWKREMVDLECPRFQKLLDAQKHDLAGSSVKRFQQSGWREYLIHPHGHFLHTAERDPPKKLPKDVSAVTVFSTLKEPDDLAYYNTILVSAVEIALPDAVFKLYKPAKKQNLDERTRMLGMFDGKALVGLICNLLLEGR